MHLIFILTDPVKTLWYFVTLENCIDCDVCDSPLFFFLYYIVKKKKAIVLGYICLCGHSTEIITDGQKAQDVDQYVWESLVMTCITARRKGTFIKPPWKFRFYIGSCDAPS